MALDKGHEYADTELRKLEKKLEKEYTQALKDMEKKADAYFSRFKEQDEKQLALLQAGKITQDEYNKWRLNHMLTGERYNHFVESLAQDLTHTNEIAMSMLNPTLANAWAENYNYGGYEIAKGLNQNIAWELADHDTVERLIKDNPKLLPKPRVDIPKDKRWNQQKLKSALTQGIIQGESIKNISKRLQSVTDMSTSAAIRNARTATTGAENAGRMQSYEDAEELGIQMQKQWISTLDDRTRESHVLLDQEIVNTDETFSNKLMYPGDPNGAPEEVYNCRCTMIGVLKNHHYKMDNRANKLGGMSYEEWKGEQKEVDKPSKTEEEALTALYGLKNFGNKTKDGYTMKQNPLLDNGTSEGRLKANSIDIQLSDDEREKGIVDVINMSDISSTQPFVVTSAVKNAIEKSTSHSYSSDYPVGIQVDDKVYLIDGNHRAVTALLRGAKKIKVRIVKSIK